MKRVVVYIFINGVAFAIIMNFFFGSGGVKDLVYEKQRLVRLQIEAKEKELSLLSQESDLLSDRFSRNIDEYLVKHGYKPENTVIFRFVSPPPSPSSPSSSYVISRLYLVCGILVLSLIIGETCLYFLSKGAFR
ncbi:MAG: hypothetical protein N2314_02070 [Brevinematales bacterium]|nr:hypothetical protein [Brevinematales bacterium]